MSPRVLLILTPMKELPTLLLGVPSIVVVSYTPNHILLIKAAVW